MAVKRQDIVNLAHRRGLVPPTGNVDSVEAVVVEFAKELGVTVEPDAYFRAFVTPLNPGSRAFVYSDEDGRVEGSVVDPLVDVATVVARALDRVQHEGSMRPVPRVEAPVDVPAETVPADAVVADLGPDSAPRR
jgi:hypothetical protein